MKVIFLQDLSNVARAGDLKEVANGYARNFLIPKKLAMVAKPGVANIGAARQTKIAAELTELANKLEGVEINLKARVGAKDRLFGAITAADIAAQLNETAGVDIDKRKIELDKPIHELGSYEIAIRLAKDIMPKIRVTVSEQETEEEPKEAAKGKAKEEAKDKVEEIAKEEAKEKAMEETVEETKEETEEEAE